MSFGAGYPNIRGRKRLPRKERSIFIMRKEKVVKLIVSAVAAAYVAVVPVQAKDEGEGSGESSVAEESAGEERAAEENGGAGYAGDGNSAGEADGGERCLEERGAESKDSGEGVGDGRWGEENAWAETGADRCGDADNGVTNGSVGALGADSGPDPGEDWAQYSAMGEPSGEELVKEMSAVERIIWRKANYGPHMLSVKKEEEPEPEPEPAAYSEEDLYVLAHAICGEGQGYPDEEQLYIGSVILNRRAHGAYPDSIRGVVFQRGQYACTRDGNYYREPTEANWRNARWLLENGSILPANVVYQAGFRQGSGLYVQTRYHKYCYR